MIAFDAFVGVPFVPHGRAPAGADCWGLVRLVFSAAGIDLPSFAEDYETVDDTARLDALIRGHAAGEWVPVADGAERALDVALFRAGRDIAHIGVVVRPGRVLHMDGAPCSVIEDYRTARFRRRLAGFYRHESLA